MKRKDIFKVSESSYKKMLKQRERKRGRQGRSVHNEKKWAIMAL